MLNTTKADLVRNVENYKSIASLVLDHLILPGNGVTIQFKASIHHEMLPLTSDYHVEEGALHQFLLVYT